jgi:hypothetical protein
MSPNAESPSTCESRPARAWAACACSASDSGTGTRVTVTYALTALTPEGNTTLKALDAEAYEAFIESWESSIRAAITT